MVIRSPFGTLLGSLLDPVGLHFDSLWEALGSILDALEHLGAHLGAFWSNVDALGMGF